MGQQGQQTFLGMVEMKYEANAVVGEILGMKAGAEVQVVMGHFAMVLVKSRSHLFSWHQFD